jgi:hypothetical protein
VPRLLVILRNALSYLSRSHPYDRILIGVVVARPREYIDPEGAFFQYVRLSRKRLFDNKSQERGISLAVSKMFALDDPLELIEKLGAAEVAFFEQGSFFFMRR